MSLFTIGRDRDGAYETGGWVFAGNLRRMPQSMSAAYGARRGVYQPTAATRAPGSRTLMHLPEHCPRLDSPAPRANSIR
ncbi:unnamed protein product [Parnassius apollo]|uniref:(apollo) hypothetical protein n=1 Tax=Parnassius apollo TaxID=110799 RepID=A0A8S3XRV7_PARAO|nr:unnamed protein product [Parnassius apollo]